MAQDDGLAGHYDRDSNTAYINDQNNDSTGELVTTAGHEMAHAMDNQDEVNNTYSKADREIYADNYGDNFADYTDMALDINGYDEGMVGSNSHTGNNSAYVQANNQQYNELDKSKGDSRQAHISRDLNIQTLRDAGIDIPDHRANVVIRDNLTDYPADIRAKLGDPIYVPGKGYVYVLEDLSIPGEAWNKNGNVSANDKLYPSVNDSRPYGVASPTLDDYKNGTGHLQVYQTLPDDYAKEDALMRDYMADIDNGVANAPDYPGMGDTVGCALNSCEDKFRNSNTSADERLESAGVTAPDSGMSSVPGGLYDRENSTNTSGDRGGDAVDMAVEKVKEKAKDAYDWVISR